MSHVYYDSLLDLGQVEDAINSIAQTSEEKHKLWHIVDEMVHHSVLDCVLENLDETHHQEYLSLFSAAPHDQNILAYLGEHIEHDIAQLIRERIAKLVAEIISYLSPDSDG